MDNKRRGGGGRGGNHSGSSRGGGSNNNNITGAKRSFDKHNPSKYQRTNEGENKRFASNKPTRGGSATAAPQGPSTPQQSRQAQKEKREYRKSFRSNHDIITQAKTYWERIRDKDNITSAERSRLITELLSIIKGELMNVIRKHDGSRIIQSCVKYGSAAQRTQIFTELQGHFLELARAQYSRFLVNRIIGSATRPQKEIIFKEFYGNVIPMIKHKEAAEVIEKAFQESTPLQKCCFMEEFYGKEFALFKTEKKRSLAEVLEEKPNQKEQILKNISDVTAVLVTKGLLYLTVAHHVLHQYFENASVAQKQDMSAMLGGEVIHAVRSKLGAQVAVQVVAYSTAKQRKAIIKVLKANVAPISKEQYGHMLIIKLLDCVDDTVLVAKAILKELFESLEEVALDSHGKLALLQLVVPRSTRYFSSAALKMLEPNELIDPKTKNLVPASKKDLETRKKELLSHTGKDLLQFCSTHADKLIFDKSGQAVFLETLANVQGDKSDAFEAVITLVEQAKESKDDAENVLRHPVGSRVVKTMISADIKSQEGDNNEVSFADKLFEVLKDDLVDLLQVNYSNAIVTALLKNPSTAEKAKKVIKPKINKVKFSEDNKAAALVKQLLAQ